MVREIDQRFGFFVGEVSLPKACMKLEGLQESREAQEQFLQQIADGSQIGQMIA